MNSETELVETNKKGSDKWVKLICGASNEDTIAIEDLCPSLPQTKPFLMLFLLLSVSFHGRPNLKNTHLRN